MKHEIKKNLYDVNVAIDSIFEYLGEKRDFAEYLNNKILRRAIEREIEIIGEALNRALKQDPDLHIENARRIVDTNTKCHQARWVRTFLTCMGLQWDVKVDSGNAPSCRAS